MSLPVAVVTGGSSGIGEALVKNLISLSWRVVVGDMQPPKESNPNILYVQTDISSWEQQAELFQKAYAWGKRLDFCALNAGVDDRDNIFNTLSYDLNKPPLQPNITVFSVNIIGTYYGVKLAAHYMTVPSLEAGKPKPGGKIVITASGGGIFPLPAIPQYTASKHALVGLVRALARNPASIAANVRINAVCPSIVDTPGLPRGLVEKLPPDQITPMSTILQAFDALAELGNAQDEGWVQYGRVGETVEANVHEFIWHTPPPRAQGTTNKFVRETGILAVAEAYSEKALQSHAK
ncbi:uncharacterized protein A1O9_02246 [Exophiala aquamarina CBS 119918]|uniref:Uncharacterized protein n=1 Tax=Exophiala aquamarina CBS 119918 TaxID=1182545 RepID=A0A072PYJ8_9EURO|nr:uncharacterized protein A1O9_02246 [Exophiala aquamarina CBS 119918]KEF60685.1 hypothetical protein A1O9_02246 [Exophiala aquamarina CBS 119918]